MISDAGVGVAQPSFGIDLVEPGSLDEAVDRGGAVAAVIGAREQPVLATDRDAAQRSFGGVVVDLEPAVVDVAGVSAFSRAFKRRERQSPGSYRRKRRR